MVIKYFKYQCCCFIYNTEIHLTCFIESGVSPGLGLEGKTEHTKKMIRSKVAEATSAFTLSLELANTFAIHSPEIIYIQISPCRKLLFWDFILL